LFTFSVAEGLGDHAGEAARGAKEVRASGLEKYLVSRTSALIDSLDPGFEGRKPTPKLYRARDAEDHVLARLE
jgi:hypothetical protein